MALYIARLTSITIFTTVASVSKFFQPRKSNENSSMHLLLNQSSVTLSFVLGAKRRDENSEEAQLRRKQRAKKRKQQMQKQVEETKVIMITT